MTDIKPGIILIAEPFLKDLNFIRSVIFLCEHQGEDGSFGFVINHKCNKSIGELITDLETCDFPVYYGGPVQMNTVHFLHRCPHFLPDGIRISDGIYWGADFAEVAELIKLYK
ncbi:MAG: YqgE/AlgH family protein, partial [Parafilimonas sp.]